LEIKTPKSEKGAAERAVAELAATLYDESLDAYQPHSWLQRFNFFHYDQSSAHASFVNVTKGFQHLKGNWREDSVLAEMSFRHFPPDLVQDLFGFQWRYDAERGGMSSGRIGRIADTSYFRDSLAMAPASAAVAPAAGGC